MFRTKLTFGLNSHRNIDFPAREKLCIIFIGHEWLISRVTNRRTKRGRRRDQTHAWEWIDIWQKKKKKKKKPRARGAANCSRYFLFARPLPVCIGWHWEYNRSYLSVQQNVLRRRLSYESALNANSNEINMPDGSFRVIYGHGCDTGDLRGFVTNFSTSNSSREITIALTDFDRNVRESR